ncbi:hypothetical protein CM19_00525 [Candidatus Acidianus copahuensis]|uniref:Uncharacterized protein n=1 Tax=Candidatus Acidianus copahuensis TaxID=1160895 RepID=A0A031LW64_9CREN|nr:hypothetical protein CM19_00525 [Candidatus Acidianus copahuensis]
MYIGSKEWMTYKLITGIRVARPNLYNAKVRGLEIKDRIIKFCSCFGFFVNNESNREDQKSWNWRT